VRFVLGNRLMDHAGGTETHLVTLGAELLRLGHEVVIYSPELGPFADYARRRGIDVVDELRELPDECDVVFAQDGLVVYDLAARYPGALTVFRICGDVYDFQSPPQVEGVVDLVVVLSDRYARLAQACAVQAPLLRLRVPIDVDRLVPVGAIRSRPRRAVILGNYPDRVQVVREAWGRRGVEVSRVGGEQQRYDIAAALESADIVVAKSRAALDAMACGRAVYVYDTFGGDGWVTPETYAALEQDSFAGQATDRVIGAAELEQDLGDYHSGMGTANRDLVIQHHRARDHVIELLAAIEASRPPERPTAPLRELARLTALQWSWERLARQGQHAQAALHERLVLAEQAAARAVADAERARAEALTRAGEAASLRGELDAIQASRAWPVALRYWVWRNRLVRMVR
jgi:hypothetical protein